LLASREDHVHNHPSGLGEDLHHDKLHVLNHQAGGIDELSIDTLAGVITDAQHGTKKTIPDVHHRKWSWADEQGFHRRFVLPFADRYNWTKKGSVFAGGPDGAWDEDGAHQGCMVKHGDYYYLFYTGRGVGNLNYNGIGVARSTNPAGPFTRLNEGQPIIERVAGTWRDGVGTPSVIYDDYETDALKKWKMWFLGTNPGFSLCTVGYSYAENPDGPWSTPVQVITAYDMISVSATKFGKLYYAVVGKDADKQLYLWVSKNPNADWVEIGNVLAKGAAGTWDDTLLNYITISYILGVYYCFYSGYDGTNYRIGMSFSPTACLSADTLTRFLKYVRNPVLDVGAPGEFDETHVFCPSVMQVEDTFYMWYSGVNPVDRQIGLATIP